MRFLWLAMIFLACYTLGSLFLRLFGVRWSSLWQHTVMAAGCGLGLSANVIFLFGTAGLLSWLAAVVSLVGLAAVGVVLASWRWRDRSSPAGGRAKLTAVDLLILVALGGSLALNGLVALAPPTAADTVNYHFAYPKLYLEAGRVSFIHGSFQANIMNLHMLYLLGMHLSGAKLAALVSWGTGLLLVGAVIVAGLNLFASVRIGLMAAALLYTTPLVTQVAVTGHVEVGLTLFLFLALLAFLEWAEDPRSLGWLALSGVFAGFAAGTKYYGLIGIVVLGVLTAVVLTRRGLFGRIAPSLLVFGFVACVVASPFYVRNAIHTGNPVYPTLYGIFGGRYWSDELDASFRVFVGQYKGPLGRDVAGFLTGPWILIIRDGLSGYGPGVLSLLPLIPLAVWWERRSGAYRTAALLLVFSSLFYLLWFLEAAQRSRHLLPAMAALSLLAALAVERAPRKKAMPRILAAGAVAIGVVLGAGFNGVYNAGFLPVVFGIQSEESFLERKLWYFRDVRWINRHLGSDDKLFSLIHPVHQYLDVNYVPTSIHIHGFLDWTRLGDEEDLYQRLRSQRFTHVFFDSAVFSTVENRQADAVQRLERHVALLFRNLVSRYGEAVYQDERIVPLYRSLDGPQKVVRPAVFRLRG